MQRAVQLLKEDSTYISLFDEAYPAEGDKINPLTIANSISNYVRSLVSFNSPFDRYMNGDKKSLAENEKKDSIFFAGKRKMRHLSFHSL